MLTVAGAGGISGAQASPSSDLSTSQKYSCELQSGDLLVLRPDPLLL